MLKRKKFDGIYLPRWFLTDKGGQVIKPKPGELVYYVTIPPYPLDPPKRLDLRAILDIPKI